MQKLLLILLVPLIGGALYVYFDPVLNQQARRQFEEVLDSNQSRILYRWQDAGGQWQISDQPPPAGTPYETVQYDRETNVIPAQNLTGQK